MKSLSSRFSRGLSKGKDEEPNDIALPSTSTPYQNKNLPPLPPISEWPPSLEQPRRSIGTPMSIATFEPLPKAELSSLSLPSIGDTEDYIATPTAHPKVPLTEVAVEESTGAAVTFDITSPCANQDSASHQKDNDPLLLSLKEWPPQLEQPQRSIGTATLITSLEPLPGLSSLPIAPTGDRSDHITIATTNSTIPRSNVAVEASADSDTAAAFDIESPRVDQDLAERSSRENGGYDLLNEVAFISSPPSPTSATGKATTIRPPSPHPFKVDHDDDNPIDHSLPHTRPPCWSDRAEEDLVTHLGPSERSRQEIMWEIVTSEER